MNRVLAHTGAKYPILQAPMGWIARAQLASAVSRAGGLGIIETSSGETNNCQAEITKMGALGLPFGVNLPIRFLRDDAMLKFVCASGVKFVTTSAGSPVKFIQPLKDAGIIVYHAVPTVDAARKCVDAGIDGLVVEGAEGGGFKNPEEVSTLVLLQAIRACVDVPLIALAASATAAAWRRRLRWGPKPSRWARALSAVRKARCMSITKMRLSRPRKPAPGCSMPNPPPAFAP